MTKQQIITISSALSVSKLALEDWLAFYSDTEFPPERVTEARKRCDERGTIAYISGVLAKIKKAQAMLGKLL